MNAHLLPTDHAELIRASDLDRDRALDLLREHWLAGRLTLGEYEDRCGEAAGGRFVADLRHAIRELPYPLPEHGLAGPAPAPAGATRQPPAPTQGTAIASIVMASVSLMALIGSFGVLFLLTLPASTWAWTLGRRARRGGACDVRVVGTIGEVVAIIATVLGVLALSACAMIIGLA